MVMSDEEYIQLFAAELRAVAEGIPWDATSHEERMRQVRQTLGLSSNEAARERLSAAYLQIAREIVEAERESLSTAAWERVKHEAESA